MGTHLLGLLQTQTKKRQIRINRINDYLPERGNLLKETVHYKTGDTIFEALIIRGSSERFIKSKTIRTSTDQKDKERYNDNSNLFFGYSLQEE